MARWYDVKSQSRFEVSHPVWASRMKNKNGTTKARMDWKLATALEAEGLIQLVQGVTDIAKAGDFPGAFGAGSQWGRKMTVETYGSLLKPDNSWHPTADELEEKAKAAMEEGREIGGELHDAFHCIRTGELKEPTADQLRFHDICAFEVQRFGIGEFKTEVQFADGALGYGGTCDLTADEAGMDWKTITKDDRVTRVSEILQIAAYAKHFGWKRARIVYVLQNPMRVVRAEDFDQKRLDAGYEVFKVALALSRLIEGLA